MRCPRCNAPFTIGHKEDVGVGFLQVSSDEPSCDCFTDDDLLRCKRCHYKYDIHLSDAHSNESFCSIECEGEF